MAPPGWLRRLGAGAPILAAMMIGACAPVVAPAPPLGPTLQVVATNQTTEAAIVTFAFESELAAGEGEALIDQCSSSVTTMGEVAGTLTVRVNGDVVVDTRVVQVSDEAFYVLRIRIERDEDVFTTGPSLAQQPPSMPPQPVACGPEP